MPVMGFSRVEPAPGTTVGVLDGAPEPEEEGAGFPELGAGAGFSELGAGAGFSELGAGANGMVWVAVPRVVWVEVTGCTQVEDPSVMVFEDTGQVVVV